jgi:hypothetical protein
MVKVGTLRASVIASLLVSATVAAQNPPPNPPLNSFQCYKITDTAAKTTFTVNSEATFPGWAPPIVIGSGCILKSPPKFACLTSRLTSFSPPAAVLFDGQTQENPILCYTFKCPKTATLPQAIPAFDAAGEHSMTGKAPSLYCMPACEGPGLGACTVNEQCCSGTCNTSTGICM